jgi:hypothetical protein
VIITDTTPNERFKMIVKHDGDEIHDIAFVQENGQRWTAHDPNAAIYQREDGMWMVGWQDGHSRLAGLRRRLPMRCARASSNRKSRFCPEILKENQNGRRGQKTGRWP